jgi:nucleotide-binding universal stress UspA family protein
MFRHILIPTDLSNRSEQAVEMANELTKTSKAKVTLLHVVETIPATTIDEFEDFYSELEKRSAKKLASLADHLKAIGTAQEIIYGRPAAEVAEFAETNGVDLIILASHKVDPSQPGRGMGTLSYKIGMLAPCSVLLVK